MVQHKCTNLVSMCVCVCVCVLRTKFLDYACTFLVNLTHVVIFMTIPMSANKINLKI
jgi:hypothetical protein